MNLSTKVIMGTILGIIIVVAMVLMIAYKDVMFTNQVTIKYSDGCVEKYVDTELVSPICEIGRKMQEEGQGRLINKIDDYNLSGFNLSVIS